MQTIITAAIIMAAAAYALWRAYKALAHPANPCDGCPGCNISRQQKRKNKEKFARTKQNP